MGAISYEPNNPSDPDFYEIDGGEEISIISRKIDQILSV